MSLSLKSITDRAFRTVFQSLLSLIELTLAQFPLKNQLKSSVKMSGFWGGGIMSNMNVVHYFPDLHQVAVVLAVSL